MWILSHAQLAFPGPESGFAGRGTDVSMAAHPRPLRSRTGAQGGRKRGAQDGLGASFGILAPYILRGRGGGL